MIHKWTQEQIQYLKDNAATMPDRVIAEQIGGLSVQQIQWRRRKLGLHKLTGGDVQFGTSRGMSAGASDADERFFQVHATDCWLTGIVQ